MFYGFDERPYLFLMILITSVFLFDLEVLDTLNQLSMHFYPWNDFLSVLKYMYW